MYKRPYLGNGLTDKREILHDEAYSPYDRTGSPYPILKSAKRSYLGNGLTDLREIWHCDTHLL